MKLVTFRTSGNDAPRLGIVQDEGVLDLTGAPGVPGTMRELLAGGDAAMDAARRAGESGAAVLPLDAVHFSPPVPNPSKMLGIGLNYGDHIEETGMAKPEVQMWFNKQVTCANGPYDGINLPAVSSAL
ncbi:MAG: 5-carboxymethyl-2-hydroxymuconate isomerase, partial [Gammaproteobacteria bacterium]|nr:5-carboxymethyl-2-hydroxymuconate isomerase [Gammaproteobacteria bacterium]MYG14091.1 5-carboxymethyl-2-hydroxymuconate isomerase [Gammaproteobacteria bacterium]